MTFFIPNLKKLPRSFIIGLIIIIFLEVFLFTNAYILADRSTICIAYKNKLIKTHHSADIIFLGGSRTLAINAKALEDYLGGKFTVYNYAVPSLGSDLQLYLSLKKYLTSCKKPKLVIASFPPGSFHASRENYVFYSNQQEGNKRRFYRFVSARSLLLDTPPFKQKYLLFYNYLKTITPSINYASFIKSSLEKRNSVESIRYGRSIIKRMQSTNGQILYPARNPPQELTNVSKKIVLNGVKNFGFEKFLELCDKNEIRIIFFFMPIKSLKGERPIELEYIEHYEKYLKSLESKYRHYEYYEINNCVYESEYFGQGGHLNEEGAARFNEEFKEYLKDML